MAAAKDVVPPAAPAPVEVPVITDQQFDNLMTLFEDVKTYTGRLEACKWAFEKGLGELLSEVEGLRNSPGPSPAARKANSGGNRRVAAPPARASQFERKRAAVPAGDVHVKAGARRMLEVLAAHSQYRVTRAQLATLARMKVTGGTFQTYYGTLKREGLMKEENGEVQITEAGMDYLGVEAPPPPQTTEELLAQWRGALKAGAARMLDLLAEIYPDSTTKEALARELGMEVTGGTFQTYLGTLRRNGLAETDGGEVRASDTLFIGGG